MDHSIFESLCRDFAPFLELNLLNAANTFGNLVGYCVHPSSNPLSDGWASTVKQDLAQFVGDCQRSLNNCLKHPPARGSVQALLNMLEESRREALELIAILCSRPDLSSVPYDTWPATGNRVLVDDLRHAEKQLRRFGKSEAALHSAETTARTENRLSNGKAGNIPTTFYPSERATGTGTTSVLLERNPLFQLDCYIDELYRAAEKVLAADRKHFPEVRKELRRIQANHADETVRRMAGFARAWCHQHNLPNERFAKTIDAAESLHLTLMNWIPVAPVEMAAPAEQDGDTANNPVWSWTSDPKGLTNGNVVKRDS